MLSLERWDTGTRLDGLEDSLLTQCNHLDEVHVRGFVFMRALSFIIVGCVHCVVCTCDTQGLVLR